jgi:hypothetical protein
MQTHRVDIPTIKLNKYFCCNILSLCYHIFYGHFSSQILSSIQASCEFGCSVLGNSLLVLCAVAAAVGTSAELRPTAIGACQRLITENETEKTRNGFVRAKALYVVLCSSARPQTKLSFVLWLEGSSLQVLGFLKHCARVR